MVKIPVNHQISAYLSFRLKGQQPESRYQLVSEQADMTLQPEEMRKLIPPEMRKLIPPESQDQKITFTWIVDTELEEQFVSFAVHPDWRETMNYLDFHYKKYRERHPGNEFDFFVFLADRIEGLFPYEGKHLPIPETRRELILAWIEGKRNAKGKPRLTVKQIALFFYYLSIAKVFRPDRKFFIVDKGHEKKPYNFIGYSPNTIYREFRVMDGGKFKDYHHDSILTSGNLKAVLPYLKNYPVALKKAQNDLYGMDRG